MGKLIKNFIYNGTYKLLLIIMPLITTPYLTRVLGKTALGIDSYVVSVISLVQLFGALGINLYSNREIAYRRDNKEELTKIYYEIQTIRWCLCAVVVLVYVLIASRTEYHIYFLIQTFSIVAYFIDVTWLFVGCEEMKTTVIRNVIVKLIQTVLIFGLIKNTGDLDLYVWINALCNFCSAICIYPQVHKWVGKCRFSELTVTRHIGPILALFLPQAASSIYVQFDRTMIGWFASDISYVSIYDKAENLVKLPLQFSSAATAVMIPRIANEYVKKNRRQVKRILETEFRYFMLFIIPAVAGILVISDTFVCWYLGVQYVESAMVIKVLSPIIFAIGMGEIIGSQLLVSVNETRGMTIAFVSGGVLDVIINALLIPKLDAVGAGIGTAVAEAVVIMIQYQFAKKYIGGFRFKNMLPKKICAAVVMFVVIELIGMYKHSVGMMFLQVLIGIMVYLAGLILLRDTELITGYNVVKKYITGKKNSGFRNID